MGREEVQKLGYSQSLEDLVKTFPLIEMGEKKVVRVVDDERRLQKLEKKRQVSPGRKYETPPHLAMGKEKEEMRQESKSARVRAWIEAQK